MELSILAAAGFCLAAYSVVGNDSIQTLGTFLSSNKKVNWKWIWFFIAGILVATKHIAGLLMAETFQMVGSVESHYQLAVFGGIM